MNWLVKLEKTKKDLEKNINLEKRKLMMEKEMLSFKVSNLEKKIEELADMEMELETYKKERNEIKKLEENKISDGRFIKDLEERISKIKNSNQEIEKRGEEIAVKVSLLENPEPACPICSREMRYDYKLSIKSKLKSQAEREKNIFKKNLEQMKELERKRELNKDKLKDIERKLLAKPLVFEKVSELEEKIAETREEAKALRDLEKKEVVIKETLSKKAYAPMSQKLLKEVDKEIRKNL